MILEYRMRMQTRLILRPFRSHPGFGSPVTSLFHCHWCHSAYSPTTPCPTGILSGFCGSELWSAYLCPKYYNHWDSLTRCFICQWFACYSISMNMWLCLRMAQCHQAVGKSRSLSSCRTTMISRWSESCFATKSVTEGIDECSPAQRSLTASWFFHGTPCS